MRGIGDTSWAASRAPGCEKIFQYEADINRKFWKLPNLRFACIYDSSAFSRSVIEEALLVHGRTR